MSGGCHDVWLVHQSQREYETTKDSNFLKTSKWSPDGSCWLTSSDDNHIRLYALPENTRAAAERLLTSEDLSCGDIRASVTCEAMPWIEVDNGEPPYDVNWHPSMNSAAGDYCFFAEVSRGHPIHVRRAFDGSIVSSYLPFNDQHEVAHTYCAVFRPDGSRLFGGVKQGIRIFDVERPGRQIQDVHFGTKKCHGERQLRGIVSSLSFKNEGVMANKVAAIGTFTGSLGLWSEHESRSSRGRQQNVVHLDDGAVVSACKRGGVVQVEWSSEFRLLSGHRQDSIIRCWDVRMPSQLYAVFPRATPTCQRFYFGLSKECLWSGSVDGSLVAYDLTTCHPTTSVAAHCSPCVSVDCHPRLPLLVTCCGTRAFEDVTRPITDGGDSRDYQATATAESDDEVDLEDDLERFAGGGLANSTWGDVLTCCCRVWCAERPRLPPAGDGLNGVAAAGDGLNGEQPHDAVLAAAIDGLNEQPHDAVLAASIDDLSEEQPHDAVLAAAIDDLSGEQPHDAVLAAGIDGLNGEQPHDAVLTAAIDDLSGEQAAAVGLSGEQVQPRDAVLTAAIDGLSGEQPHDAVLTAAVVDSHLRTNDGEL